MLQMAEANLRAVEVDRPIRSAVADAGYFSEANIQEADGRIDLFILFIAPTKEWKRRNQEAQGSSPRGHIPRSLSWRERMERKLRTKRGRRLYSLRAKTIEPVRTDQSGSGYRPFFQARPFGCKK
ncbi:MAG: hypothetical protein BAA01_04130 [Bacillus thermozeamaize]|uniref:Transposase IS4-like domain-containing protein n=1 Tax=Bacillus thermozeamaize TaxID=230954 RepID=A0A1Y3PCZ6_9BACI|nr:MAG: hypothetical protein BAA01_04130 [Bacillus thermozeamaize]